MTPTTEKLVKFDRMKSGGDKLAHIRNVSNMAMDYHKMSITAQNSDAKDDMKESNEAKNDDDTTPTMQKTVKSVSFKPEFMKRQSVQDELMKNIELQLQTGVNSEDEIKINQMVATRMLRGKTEPELLTNGNSTGTKHVRAKRSQTDPQISPREAKQMSMIEEKDNNNILTQNRRTKSIFKFFKQH
eukprot:CAMPEP_0114654432 /NCGR_PEP_ID=MMETSP0191-20121206/10483_1 /TAXON_ID=126664 /ORGANISM="Sorites sp." /LENGTH=185 /DNA_ID=CAMNT_0001869931 /DNA_START=321 /DNA_END=878 /DNA_ORIENTATION=+